MVSPIKIQLIVYGPRNSLGKRNYCGVWCKDGEIHTMHMTSAVAASTSAPQIGIREFRRQFGRGPTDAVAKALPKRRKSIVIVSALSPEELLEYLAQNKVTRPIKFFGIRVRS